MVNPQDAAILRAQNSSLIDAFLSFRLAKAKVGGAILSFPARGPQPGLASRRRVKLTG